ncbi:AbrB/MazE/SpoVT family DNA-binding domain-containing protein [Massiliimalia massiliensis]|uniref:AbrB/MazE/SpoVT family DNA-binding domain-containing protein n=1 Tax=Massiliimalia massiliensis TaxID=1852384 RepID=UPI0013564A5D|nr:AbrB/MazE/SpoVT family DNA-binding domain-containing protein [Massiliimalia massiliensis]
MKIKIDSIGRVVIPVQIRKYLELRSGDCLDVFFSEEGIVMKKREKTCMICHTEKDLVRIGRHALCGKCLKKLAARQKKRSG